MTFLLVLTFSLVKIPVNNAETILKGNLKMNKKYYKDDEIVFTQMPKHRSFIDLTRKRYGKLTVLGYTKQDGYKAWFTKCDCGLIVVSLAASLKNGMNSCGCSKKQCKNNP